MSNLVEIENLRIAFRQDDGSYVDAVLAAVDAWLADAVLLNWFERELLNTLPNCESSAFANWLLKLLAF